MEVAKAPLKKPAKTTQTNAFFNIFSDFYLFEEDLKKKNSKEDPK